MEDSKRKLMQDSFNEGRFTDAIKIAEEHLANCDGSDWDAIIMKATILSLPDPKFCDYHTAIGMALYGLNYQRADAYRWVGVAEVFQNCGLQAEAERCYRTALELNSTNYDAVVGLAILHTVGYPGVQIAADEMKALLESAIANEPNKWLAYLYLARILRKSGDKEKAMELYQSATEKLLDSRDKYTRQELEKEIKTFKEEIT